jgi:exonuclease SbcD
MDPARIIFVGDLHLGRRPTALPADLAEFGLGPAELGPDEVWRRTVALALEERAHAVVLAGDVVDREDDRFGAGRALRAGVSALAAAGIPVISVVGNHDVTALPRVAEAVDGFELIGARGVWQTLRLEPDGAVPVQLVGWSFPEKRVTRSPLATLDRGEISPEVATLGVLHCDLDAGKSPYAPVRMSELDETGFDAWLLGHVHKPADLATRPFGYLGSMSGLDPGEPGAHGPWWLEVEGPGRVRARQVPLAPIRYETVDCALTGLSEGDREDVADDLDGRIRNSLASLRERLDGENALGRDRARLVICRVRLRGAERHRPGVRRVLADDRFIGTHVFGETCFSVERLVEDARPDFDLDHLAEGNDAPGLLAKRLIALRDGHESVRPFLARTRAALTAQVAVGRFGGLLDPPSWEQAETVPDELVEMLLRVGTRELEGLLAQRSAQPARTEDAP